MPLTAETLVRCGVPADKARAHLPHIRAAMREHEITSQRRARMFLAQVLHESMALKFFEEIWGPTAAQRGYEGRSDLGNNRPGDGKRFKGRGPIQLTGRANYTLYGKLLGIDLTQRPEVAATPRVGWRTSALYFQRRGCNAGADRGDVVAVTKMINGGLNGLEDRKRFYALLGGHDVRPGPAFLRRGDTGDAVVVASRRLSFVRDEDRRRYLDGKRKKFDAEMEEALRAFQEDHGLKVDGRLGPRSTRALAHATEREKKRRARLRAENEGVAPRPERPERRPGTKPETETQRPPRRPGSQAKRPQAETGRPARRRITADDILDNMDRLDVRGDRMREALRKRLEKLEALEARRRTLSRAELEALDDELERLDERIDTVRATIAAGAKAPTADAPTTTTTKEPAKATVVAGAVVTQTNPAETTAMATAAQPAGHPADLTATVDLEDLIERLFTLNAEEDTIRKQLEVGFAELEHRVGVRRRRSPRVEQGNGKRPVRPQGRPRPRPRPADRPPRPAPDPHPDDGREGKADEIAPDERSFQVRQSKLALIRYLRRQRKQTTRALRRTLQLELRSPRKAKVATPAWERAVREAQEIARLPETGTLDARLRKALRKDWPSESAVRRAARGTPAWRLIPGQLSPNFNVREFACNDGTDYVAGLMREQRLTKGDAKKRAKELADRLERLRAREGNRAIHLNSVFRTKAHNAKVGGVPGSAHTRGYAADIRPPSGITIASHREHVRKVFSGGVGRYATFVHGDFDPNERGQNWVG